MTAEDLMRSRYTAFVDGDEDYLRRSWDPSTCPATIHLSDGRIWTGLTVHSTAGGGALEQEGTVSFTARFIEHGETGEVSETSLFLRSNGAWVYLGERATEPPWNGHAGGDYTVQGAGESASRP